MVLRHLAEPAAVLPLGQRGEHVGVAQHRGGLPERADEVLALGQVDPGLAADRGVDLAEQRGGHVHHRHARGGTRRRRSRPTSVTTPPPTATTASARVRPQPPNCRQSSSTVPSVLACLTVAQQEHPVLDAGVDLDRDAGLAHDRDAPDAGRQHVGQEVAHARPTSTS